MPCYGPLTGYYSKEVEESGKRKIVFRKDKSHTGLPVQVPCGQCVGCRLERARQWAVRLDHERKLHKASSFLTLTYDDKHLPAWGNVSVRDVQLFNKRLRKFMDGELVKFYACVEYGDENKRPHAHMILFGYDFKEDRRFFTRNKRDEPLYTSATLEGLWQNGHCIIGDVSFESAAYVARYCVKKINGPKAKDHYTVVNADGEVFVRRPEHGWGSNGLGKGFYEKFGQSIRDHDTVLARGMIMPPPRYYDRLSEEVLGPEVWKRVKRERKRKAVLNKSDNTTGFHGRLRVKELVALAKLRHNKRSV